MDQFVMRKKPSMSLFDVAAGGMVLFGLLFVVASIHVAAINTTDAEVADFLATLFSVTLNVYIAVVIFAIVGVIIQMLRILVWNTQTPEWVKREMKENR